MYIQLTKQSSSIMKWKQPYWVKWVTLCWAKKRNAKKCKLLDFCFFDFSGTEHTTAMVLKFIHTKKQSLYCSAIKIIVIQTRCITVSLEKESMRKCKN